MAIDITLAAGIRAALVAYRTAMGRWRVAQDTLDTARIDAQLAEAEVRKAFAAASVTTVRLGGQIVTCAADTITTAPDIDTV